MTTALALCLAAAGLDGVSAQAAGQAVPGTTPAATAPAERSDDELWNELKALSGSPVEDGLWEAAEAATEHVFGSALERETGEKVFETIAAALERDWRGAAQLAGPEILSAYLPGVGQYIELVQSAAQQIDRVTDEWAAQLYDHDSYRWVEEQVMTAMPSCPAMRCRSGRRPRSGRGPSRRSCSSASCSSPSWMS